MQVSLKKSQQFDDLNSTVYQNMKWYGPKNWKKNQTYGVDQISYLHAHFKESLSAVNFELEAGLLAWKLFHSFKLSYSNCNIFMGKDFPIQAKGISKHKHSCRVNLVIVRIKFRESPLFNHLTTIRCLVLTLLLDFITDFWLANLSKQMRAFPLNSVPSVSGICQKIKCKPGTLYLVSVRLLIYTMFHRYSLSVRSMNQQPRQLPVLRNAILEISIKRLFKIHFMKYSSKMSLFIQIWKSLASNLSFPCYHTQKLHYTTGMQHT